jgi:hypothetical protein
MTDFDVIALARSAGVCFPDCHFLDASPYEDLLDVIASLRTEAERDDYIQLVRAEESRRREKLHALERFAAAVLHQAAGELERKHLFQAMGQLELMALELNERNRTEVQS